MTEDTCKHKYDLESATAGGFLGAAAGTAVAFVINPILGIAGAVAGGVFGGYPTDSESKPGISKIRSSIIGGLTGLALYGIVYGGEAIGHYAGKESQLIPFQTSTDRGVVVKRNDGTKTPYIFNEKGKLIPLSEVKTKDLGSLTLQKQEQYKLRETQIYDSITTPTKVTK